MIAVVDPISLLLITGVETGPGTEEKYNIFFIIIINVKALYFLDAIHTADYSLHNPFIHLFI